MPRGACPSSCGPTPTVGDAVLVFNAWEHARYLYYRNVRPDYVDSLWACQLDRHHRRLDAARASKPKI